MLVGMLSDPPRSQSGSHVAAAARNAAHITSLSCSPRVDEPPMAIPKLRRDVEFGSFTRATPSAALLGSPRALPLADLEAPPQRA